MQPVDVLRAVAQAGIGLAATDKGLAVYADAPGSEPLTNELRAAVRACKPALLRLIDGPAVRRGWRVPDDVALCPLLATILAWLLAERLSFTGSEYRRWLEQKTAHIDTGAPRYVADILATDVMVRERLRAVRLAVGTDREAA